MSKEAFENPKTTTTKNTLFIYLFICSFASFYLHAFALFC